MTGSTTLILGGGTGGLTTANALRQQLGPEHRVVLVDKRGEHLFTPSLLWLMVGARGRAQLTKDLRAMVRPGVEVIQAEVQELDPAARRVVAGGRDLEYDALVVALGADLAPGAFPGFAPLAFNFFDLEGAAALWSALQEFTGGRVAVVVTALPYKCPAAPYEAALLIDDALRCRGVRGHSEVAVFTPEPQPMPVAGPVLGQAVTTLLAQRDIQFHPSRPVQAIDPERRELVFQDGTRERFDLLAAVPPHRPPAVIQASALANQAGWIPVDTHTLQTAFEHVYAIGDVTTITLANGKPLPKAGVFAHAEGTVVAQTLAATLARAGKGATFDGQGYCWVELGSGRAAFASGNFYAEPDPTIQLHAPARYWHIGKVLFERSWMGDGAGHTAAQFGLVLGSKLLGVPGSV